MPDYAKYDGWPDGENNLRDATELELSQLRRCVNFDVLDNGDLHRRRGTTKVHNGTVVPRTLFSNGKRVLFVESGNLWELVRNIDGSWNSMLVRLSVGNHPMTYVDVNGDIYWSNQVQTGIVDQDGNDLSWGLKAVADQPTVTAGASGGDLVAGVYQVAVTFLDAYGQESGTDLAATVTVAENNSSLLLTDIPTPTDGSTVQVYCSAVNGEVLYRVGRVVPGAPSFRITSASNNLGMQLRTQFCDKPPAGNVLEYHNGRIYIGDGNVVWFTDPLRYGSIRMSTNFMMFPDEVTVIKAVADGMFICADKTYWLSGMDTSEFQQVEVLPYGAVYGTGISLPESDNVAWFSEDGLIIAGLEAQVTTVQDDRSAVSRFQNGAMQFRKVKGIRQFVATLGTGVQSEFLAPDYVTLETSRRGNAI